MRGIEGRTLDTCFCQSDILLLDVQIFYVLKLYASINLRSQIYKISNYFFKLSNMSQSSSLKFLTRQKTP